MSDSGKAVFLSYASQDAAAARKICEALRAAGVEVWFDQSELRGGDAWDAKIRKHIKECALFVPVISANTQARHEGYFRLEWRLADQRTHLMGRAKAFLLPVSIDETLDNEADVPDSFIAVQWSRLPAGEIPPAFCEQVKKLLGGGTVAGVADPGRTPASARPATSKQTPKKTFRSWLVPAIVGIAATLAVGIWQPWRNAASTDSKVSTVLTASSGGAKPFDDIKHVAGTPVVLATEHANAEGMTKTDQKSVAVLAFANLSDDKDTEYFSDGISEELLNVLAKIPALKVSARTSAFYFKGKQVPIAEIAKQLGVAYVVEGSVRKSGDRVRITAQLIKAADGFHVWSDTFTRELKDIFALQDEIAGLIAQNLSLKIGMSPASAPREVDPEAYRLMLLGRSLINQATPANSAQAVRYLQESIHRDEKFAQAWAWLAMARWVSASSGWEPFESGFKAAREAAQQALSLQPDLPEAQTAMGCFFYGYEWDWGRARASFQQAALLAPGDALVVSNLARLAITVGQTDESVRFGRRAAELDPLNSYVQYALCMAYLQAGRFAELEKQAVQFKDLSRVGLKFQALAYLLQGRNEQALQVAEQLQVESPRLFLLTVTQWALRQTTESDASLEQLKAKYSAPAGYQIAEAYALRGAQDEAFEWLEASYRERDTGMIWLKNDPFLKNLHADPRWSAMLRKMNLADDQLK